MKSLKRKRQTKYRELIREFILKIAVVSLIAALNWAGISAIGKTFAYFSDSENSNANTYQTGTLDFSLRSGQSNFVPQEKVSNLKPGDSVARDIYIKKEGSLPFKYTAHTEPATTCDLILYNALQLKVWYNYYTATPTSPNYHENRVMALKYNGLLKDFNLRALNLDDPDLQIPNGHPYFENNFYGPDEHWFYATEIILPPDVSAELQDKSCEFKFVFDGWQTDFATSSAGFTDTESITSTISTGNWMPGVSVTHPNGGETWYLVPNGWPGGDPIKSALCIALGMNSQCQYPIRWQATNPIGDDNDLLINIEFSADSGADWMTPPIATSTSNTGEYWWKPPFDTGYITDNGRIKVTATNKDYSFLTNFDISDNDFCPPMINSEEEAIQLLASLNGVSPSAELSILGIGSNDGSTGDPISGEAPGSTEETVTSTQETPTTTKETTTTTEAMTTENITATESTTTESTTTEEATNNEEMASPEATTTEATTTEEATITGQETTTTTSASSEQATEEATTSDETATTAEETVPEPTPTNPETILVEPVTLPGDISLDDDSGSDNNDSEPRGDDGGVDDGPASTTNESGTN